MNRQKTNDYLGSLEHTDLLDPIMDNNVGYSSRALEWITDKVHRFGKYLTVGAAGVAATVAASAVISTAKPPSQNIGSLVNNQQVTSQQLSQKSTGVNSPVILHLMPSVGFDSMMYGYATAGIGLSGVLGPSTMVRLDYIMNIEEIATLVPEDNLLRIVPQIAEAPFGKASGVGLSLEVMSRTDPSQGAHGYDVGLGVRVLHADSTYGSVVVGEALINIGGSNPGLSWKAYLGVPFSVVGQSPELKRMLKKPVFGFEFTRRDLAIGLLRELVMIANKYAPQIP